MKTMALAALVHPTGRTCRLLAASRHQADASTDIDYYRSMAQLAERGMFDLFFIADTPAARTTNLAAYARFPMFMNVFEPVTLLPRSPARRRISASAAR